jgi:hypothetical protein
MNQNIWGSHLWFSLHTMSFNYPLKPTIEDRNNYKNFFINLQEVIPCSVCKKNYKRHLNEHPIENFLDNRKSFVYWVIDMHNMVNAEIGKKILSYEIVIKKYEDVYQKKMILNNEDINYKKNELEENKLEKNNGDKKIIYCIFVFFVILLIINFSNLFNKI